MSILVFKTLFAICIILKVFMLPPPESLRNAATIVLEHLRTDGLPSGAAHPFDLCGYVVWPQSTAQDESAPDLLYKNMAELLAGVAIDDPLVQQTAWGSVGCGPRGTPRQVTCETRQGDIAVIVPAPQDLPTGGTVFWFTGEALASLRSLANTPLGEMYYTVVRNARSRVG